MKPFLYFALVSVAGLVLMGVGANSGSEGSDGLRYLGLVLFLGGFALALLYGLVRFIVWAARR